MNKDEIKGKVQNLKGRAKQAAGAMSGDHRVEAEGSVERLKGAAQEAIGKAKRRVNEEDEDEDIE